jgi:hypothetical protein
MFDLIDRDKNGYISFREFLDMLVTFSKGTAEGDLRKGTKRKLSFIITFKRLHEFALPTQINQD